MTQAAVYPLSLAEAEDLFEEFRSAMANLSRLLERIIETRAWEVLGYPSLAAAWRVQLAGVQLRTDLEKALVIYEMAETETPEGVAAIVGGVGPSTVEQVLRRKQMGVAARAVSLKRCAEGESVVREHVRKRRGATRRLHVEIGEDRYQVLARECARRGITTKQFVLDAVSSRMELMARGEAYTS